MAKGRGKGGPYRPPDPRIELQHEPPIVSGGTWGVIVTAVASQGNRTLSGQPVQFFQGPAPAGSACATDHNGRASYFFFGLTLDQPALTVEAQLAGTPFRARMIISAPAKKEPEKQIPYELLVKPTRVGNRITFMIRVVDETDRNIPKSKITIVDSNIPNPQTFWTDEDGEYLHTIDLVSEKEREIRVYAAGFGEGISMTFRGRR